MNKAKMHYDNRVKPKNVLALNEKVAAIRRYEIDPVYKSVGRYFNCSPDQIKRIIKQKDEILVEWNNRTKKAVQPTAQQMKSVRMSFLGKALHEWIRRMMYYTDFNLTDALIKTIAIEFKKALGIQNFFPDKEWVANFRSTYDLRDVNTRTLGIGHQESLSVQPRDILQYVRSFCGMEEESGQTLGINELGDIMDDGDAYQIPPGTSMHHTVPMTPEMCLMPCVSDTFWELSPTVKSEPAQEEDQQTCVISTHEEAMNCVKMLEDFALLKENFRLIGLIERLEDALKVR